MSRHRHESDYIDRTIETVRQHRDADNCWPSWANIFADEIEDLRRDLAEQKELHALALEEATTRQATLYAYLREIETLCEPSRIPLPLLNSQILRVVRAALARPEGQ